MILDQNAAFRQLYKHRFVGANQIRYTMTDNVNIQGIPPIVGHSIRFTLTRRDVFWCRLWVIFHNKILWALMLLVSLFVTVNSMRAPEGVRYTVAYKIFYVVFMTGMSFFVMAMFQVAVQILFLFAAKNRGVVGGHELEIREDGLLERTDVNESLHRWSGFHKMAASGRCLYIFVTDNIVHYVPLRCFSSAQAAKDFRDEVQRRAKAAKKK